MCAYSPRWSCALAFGLIAVAQCSVEFFISTDFDSCSRNGSQIACLNNTNRGGLCAYAPDADHLWCCPAPDPTCWSMALNCQGGSSGAPGSGQIACSSNGANWCCNADYETCTQATNQINVCVSKFDSGNKDVSIASANAVESSFNSSGSSPTSSGSSPSSSGSSPSSSGASSSGISETAGAGPTTLSSSPSSSTSATTTSASSSGPAQATESSASATNAATTEVVSSSSSVSGATIAGIVLGALGGLVLTAAIAGALLFLYRRRRPHSPGAMYKDPMVDYAPVPQGPQGGKGSGVGTTQGLRRPELEARVLSVELPATEVHRRP